jgi:hypothetical protein
MNPLDYVGLDWKQRLIERVLGISGKLFYHGILRPKEYLDQRKKDKSETRRLEKRRV